MAVKPDDFAAGIDVLVKEIPGPLSHSFAAREAQRGYTRHAGGRPAFSISERRTP